METLDSHGATKRRIVDHISGDVVTTARLLGLSQSFDSELSLASRAERGLPFSALHSLRKWLALADDEVYQLIGPRRTLSRREAARQPLSRDESDRVVRLARVGAHAMNVFSREPEYALEWLRKEQTDLDDRSPLELLGTESGARAVEEVLSALEHGIFA
jgi:putative toxin-antitoxin system antitoxin component (TIGR02293 family)